MKKSEVKSQISYETFQFCVKLKQFNNNLKYMQRYKRGGYIRIYILIGKTNAKLFQVAILLAV